MTRRCSHCSNNGHNSRTCPYRGGGGGGGGLGVKLFGVRLTDGLIIKKSASMGNLSAHYHSLNSNSPTLVANPGSPCFDPIREPDGYLSDDPAHASSFANRRGERKKGVPWTEEEHRMFLVGLQKLGKGDWRGIARNFVVTRTPTQVASHAQKYFIRQSNATRRKRRASLFDMIPDMSSDPPSVPEEQLLLTPYENSQPSHTKSHPSLDLSLKSEFEPMETTTTQENEEGPNETMTASNGKTPMSLAFFPAYVPVPFSIWPSITPPFDGLNGKTYHHQVVKPIAVKEPVNVDELVGMSHLSIGERERRVFDREPSPLSLRLSGEPSRQSAFHANAPVGGARKNSVIQAV
ncbi:hypothetical protein Lal_00045641 [Lupinus albus]|uniref:Putative transcription factor MYB-HB-like family n=1 Tax=Lupinus albus TaxID=3870 RepID=A0A6A5NMT8_LUPAL|nr:putative transcription factor MYB-HB-like family [Lupinus albus]KAF1886409.1 hypothetical protein Lal_00045641 [Lupinus albus]